MGRRRSSRQGTALLEGDTATLTCAGDSSHRRGGSRLSTMRAGGGVICRSSSWAQWRWGFSGRSGFCCLPRQRSRGITSRAPGFRLGGAAGVRPLKPTLIFCAPFPQLADEWRHYAAGVVAGVLASFAGRARRLPLRVGLDQALRAGPHKFLSLVLGTQRDHNYQQSDGGDLEGGQGPGVA